MNFYDIASRFDGGRRYKEKYVCKCPAHNDKKASLSITHKDGKTLLKCGAGCNTEDILKEVCLKMSDLFDEPLEKPQKINSKNGFNNVDEVIQYLKENPINNDPVINVYKFKDEKGKVLYLKIRTKEKKFLHARVINNKLIWGLKAGYYYETCQGSNIFSSNEKNTSKIYITEQQKVLYNLDYVIRGVREDKTIYIVEGEKDADRLISNGLIATTTSTGGGDGEEKWDNSYSEYFKGAKVVILRDNDESGRKFGEEVRKSILNYCYKVQVLNISDKEKGDISDWLDDGNNISELFEKLRDIPWTYARWYTRSKKNDSITFNKNRLAHHLSIQWYYICANDGMGKGIFHIYDNGVYKPVYRLDARIKPYVYIEYQNPNTINSIADNLCQIEGIPYEDLHGSENIINLRNGLYDIKTKKLKPHTTDYKSIVQLDCDYEESPINNGIWDRYINDLSNGNGESKAFLQEVAGVILSNLKGYRLKAIVGLVGKGDSGKTPFFKTLQGVMGSENCGAVSLQKLTKSQFLASSIYGKRMIFDGDLPSDPLGSVDLIKKMSGGDVISLEFKGKDQFNYMFNGIITFCANDLPFLGADKGDHFYNRFHILPCNNVIPEEKRDPYLVENILKVDKNYIFKWALAGLERVINNDFRFTKFNVISSQREDIKNAQDSVRSFISTNYTITNVKQDKKDCKVLYTEYQNYCTEEGFDKPSSYKGFRSKLESFYGLTMTFPARKYTVHGIIKN